MSNSVTMDWNNRGKDGGLKLDGQRQCVKGEGLSDQQALDQVRSQLTTKGDLVATQRV